MKALIFALILGTQVSSFANENQYALPKTKMSVKELIESHKKAVKELKALREQSKVLGSIIEKSEYIQLQDGSSLDHYDLKKVDTSKLQSIKDLGQILKAVEGGGTGGGG